MPIDPSIALGFRGVEAPNALAQYAQVQQIQGAQQANQLNQMKMAEYERARQEEEGIRNYLAGNPNPTAPATRAGLIKFGKTGLEYGKMLNEADKSQAELGKVKAEAAAKQTELFRGQLANVKTPEQAAQWVQAQYADPILSPVVSQVPMAQAIAGIPTDPKQFENWKNQNALGMSKWVERNTMTAHEAEQLKVSQGQLDVARKRLDAEMATGTLTPQSLDLAANIYLQTGQLPTGLGKSASNLRSQVMNRATELSTGKPAAEVAGGIVEAKQDVAARGKAVKDFSTGKQGDAVRSFNTAIDHLDTMTKLANALNNKDTRLFNTVGNAFAAATGEAAPTDFDTAKSIVGGEIAKALTGSNMALKDREEIRDAINRSNSPAQLAGSVRRLQELMGGQLKSLNLQYETSTGRKDFDKKLTPRSKEVVQELSGGTAPAATGVDTSNPLLR